MNATRPTTILWLLLVSAALVAASCTGRDISIGGESRPIACGTVSDCGDGELCVQSACTVACAADSDCPAGRACVAGVCAAECSADADCATSQVCVNGLCIAHTTCAPAAEVCDGVDNDCDGVIDNGAICSNGGTCVAGACVTTACENVTCANGEACVDGVCTACAGQVVCAGLCVDLTADAANCGACGVQCPAGAACADGVCMLACASDADCTAGHVCVAGVCTPDASCSPAAEVCDGLDNDCDGVIDNDATCPNGGVCVNGGCATASCSADIECPVGQVCVAGACVAG
jgi:hypothetical protein